MAFPNFYYKRTAATAKACYICSKPTVTVLATIDTTDFFYACPVHLADHGFATRVPEPEPEPEPEPDSKKPSVNPGDIAKVKQEWEEKQRQKKDKKEGEQVSEAKNGTDGARKEAEGKDADAKTRTDDSQEKKPAVALPLPEGAASRPTHERYVLHRNIFALRIADHRRRRQAAQAKNLAPRLPGAPRSIP